MIDGNEFDREHESWEELLDEGESVGVMAVYYTYIKLSKIKRNKFKNTLLCEKWHRSIFSTRMCIQKNCA